MFRFSIRESMLVTLVVVASLAGCKSKSAVALQPATIAVPELWLAVASSATPIDKVNATTQTADRVTTMFISVLSGLHDGTAGLFANRVTLTVA